MILKKPYALLIKYFKLIHLALLLSIAFVILNLNKLFSFFSNISITNYVNMSKPDVMGYFPPLLYLAIILIILLSTVVFLLMRFKKKPKIYYLILIILNIVFLILLSYSKSYMYKILEETPNPVTNGILRDIFLFSWIICLVSVFPSILRSIGFDVKKFNFKKDIADLKIEELDNEEVELNFNIKKYEIQRKLNKKTNSIAAFFKAKKLIFVILFGILFIYLLYLLIINVFVYNKAYSENNIIQVNSYSMKINKSYFTNISNSGKMISKDYKYVVVDLSLFTKIENNKFNISLLSLESNGKSYFPIFNAYELFKDLGIGYDNQTLLTSGEDKYIVVFRVDNNINVDDLVFKHFDRMLESNKRLYKRVKLNPVGSNNNKVETIELNNDLVINDESLNIKSYELDNSFKYNYKFCITQSSCIDSVGKVSVNNDLLLKINLNKSSYTSDEISNLAYITYDKFFTKNIIVALESMTPERATKELFFKVPKDIKNAKNIYLNFITREKKYVYVLK